MTTVVKKTATDEPAQAAVHRIRITLTSRNVKALEKGVATLAKNYAPYAHHHNAHFLTDHLVSRSCVRAAKFTPALMVVICFGVAAVSWHSVPRFD